MYVFSPLPYSSTAEVTASELHDGDDHGLRHAPPTATTVDASSTLPQQKAGGARAPVAAASIDLCVVCAVVAPGHVCTSARAEMRLDSSWLARIWVSDW